MLYPVNLSAPGIIQKKAKQEKVKPKISAVLKTCFAGLLKIEMNNGT